MENLEILRSNGFDVAVEEDRPPGRGERISLVAMPVSKETTFDFKGVLWPLPPLQNLDDACSHREQISSSYCTSFPMAPALLDKWCGVARPERCSRCELADAAS